jgi:sec-independent protein translocase protein TatC
MTLSNRDSARTMTFWQHLGELRIRLFWCILAVLSAAMLAWTLRLQIYTWLAWPLQQAAPGVKLNYLAPTEPFFVYVRIALFGGVILAAPFVLAQLWAFIAPALTRSERRAIAPVVPLVLALFLSGVAFVYYGLLPLSLRFLLGMAPDMLQPVLTQDRYFSFISGLLLAGGLLFQLPLVLGVLGWLRLVTPRWLVRQSGAALVVLMAVAAIITPTGDAFNMLALTAPLMLLYFASIAVVWAIQRGQVKVDAGRVS